MRNDLDKTERLIRKTLNNNIRRKKKFKIKKRRTTKRFSFLDYKPEYKHNINYPSIYKNRKKRAFILKEVKTFRFVHERYFRLRNGNVFDLVSEYEKDPSRKSKRYNKFKNNRPFKHKDNFKKYDNKPKNPFDINFKFNYNKVNYNKNNNFRNFNNKHNRFNNKFYQNRNNNYNRFKNKRYYSIKLDEVDKQLDPIVSIVDSFHKFPASSFKIIFSELFQGIYTSYDILYMMSLFVRLDNFFYIKSPNTFTYYLFCYLLSFSKNFLEYTYDLFIYPENFYVYDLRILNTFELLKFHCNINLFYNLNFNSIFRFDDFTLKVDLYTFIILRRFLEYFRIFKYNEYIFYHLGIDSDIINYTDLKLEEKDYAMLPSFYEFRHALFFNKYLICRLNIYSRKQLIYNKVDINMLYLKTSFFLFYFVAFIYEKLHITLILYFSFYIISNIYYCLYRALIYLPKRMQILKITTFE